MCSHYISSICTSPGDFFHSYWRKEFLVETRLRDFSPCRRANNSTFINCHVDSSGFIKKKSFLKDFWSFSKKAVSGLIGRGEERPSFDKAFADEWYKNRYSVPVPLAEQ